MRVSLPEVLDLPRVSDIIEYPFNDDDEKMSQSGKWRKNRTNR